jgi:hypothetical protein
VSKFEKWPFERSFSLEIRHLSSKNREFYVDEKSGVFPLVTKCFKKVTIKKRKKGLNQILHFKTFLNFILFGGKGILLSSFICIFENGENSQFLCPI